MEALVRTRMTPLLLAVAALLLLAGARFAPATEAQRNNIFKVSLGAASGIDSMDPALASSPPAWALLDTTCARLMSYPDKRPPAAFRLQPEVAQAFPAVSNDGKTYTFKLRQGFRFSDGKPVGASAFKRAIDRTLAPAMNSPGVLYAREIVGAGRVVAGKAASASGVTASAAPRTSSNAWPPRSSARCLLGFRWIRKASA